MVAWRSGSGLLSGLGSLCLWPKALGARDVLWPQTPEVSCPNPPGDKALETQGPRRPGSHTATEGDVPARVDPCRRRVCGPSTAPSLVFPGSGDPRTSASSCPLPGPGLALPGPQHTSHRASRSPVQARRRPGDTGATHKPGPGLGEQRGHRRVGRTTVGPPRSFHKEGPGVGQPIPPVLVRQEDVA